jgi:hypothetical protein
MTNEGKLLGALRKRMRVTRKTAIQHGWSENLTADISRLRNRGYDIATVTAKTPSGEPYTRYRLMAEPQAAE